MNNNILLLGHTGMLGNAVYKFLSNNKTINLFYIKSEYRFPELEYKSFITDSKQFGYIINCCGAIHQRTSDFSINYELPDFLIESFKNTDTKIIHISSDCVFNGIEKFPYSSSSIPNATTEYGISKIKGDEYILFNPSNNYKILRTSILGIDKNKAGLLSWFLLQAKKSTISGYGDEYWQGVTTLKLAETIENCILNWSKYSKITTISSKYNLSKYDLLYMFREIFDRKDLKLVYDNKSKINRSLIGDIVTTDIKTQLKELRDFYNL